MPIATASMSGETSARIADARTMSLARLDQIGEEDVRCEVDRRRRIAQFFEELEDSGLRSHRHRDVDQIDAVGFRVLRDLVERPENLPRLDAAYPLWTAVVEIAGETDAEKRRALNPLGELAAKLAFARDDGNSPHA